MIRIVVEGANLNMREMTIIKDCTQLSLYDIRERATNHTDMLLVDKHNEQEMKNAAHLIQHLQASHVPVYAFCGDEQIPLSFFDAYTASETVSVEATTDALIRIYVRKSDRLMMSIKIIKDVFSLSLQDIKDRLDFGEAMVLIDADNTKEMELAAQLVYQLAEYHVPILVTQHGHQISPEIFRAYFKPATSTPPSSLLASDLTHISHPHAEQKPWWKKLFHLH